jgi:hypothetical protein
MLTPGRSNKIIKKTVSKPISEEPKNEGRVNTITKGSISVINKTPSSNKAAQEIKSGNPMTGLNTKPYRDKYEVSPQYQDKAAKEKTGGRRGQRAVDEYKKLPIKKTTEKVTSTMAADKAKGLMPGKPAPVPVSKAKQMALNIASKFKRG